MPSAYHVGRPMAASARELIVQLPLHFSLLEGRQSLPFSELAYALEAIGDTRVLKEQHEILTQLFERAKQVSGNSTLEMYLLLKMMIPSYDNECVYGMKTRRLTQTAADALRKVGRSDGSASIKQWLESVPLQNSMMAKGKGIVCLPELVIAAQCARASSATGPKATIANVAVVCRMLTTVYLSAQSSPQQLETAQSEILRQVIEEGGLSFQEWIALSRLLLKKITMGVGLQTVLKALPMNGARECFARQMDLSRLAETCVSGSAVAATVLCGVPFCPMTCDMSNHYMRSPYLMQWLFPAPVISKDGRIGLLDNLLVIIGDEWFVNALQANKKDRLYVNLKNDDAFRTVKARQPLVMRLRLFQEAKMLKGAKGRIIHFYMTDDKDVIQLMLLDVTEPEGKDQFKHAREWEPFDEEEENLSDLILVTEARAKDKTLLVIVKPAAVPVPGKRRGLRSDAKKQPKDKSKKLEVPKLMVQQKLDGDRIQVHIISAGEVKLFTKWGKDVTELYSNVRDDLVSLNLDQHAPCVLDGELLVVNRKTGEPIAWSSTKWAYNKPLSELVDEDDAVIALSHNGGEEDGAYGTLNNRADEVKLLFLIF